MWEESSGEGEIYTFSLMRKSASGPYAIGYVTLKEGPSLLTNFVDCDMDKLKIGQKVKVVFKTDRRRAVAVLYAGDELSFARHARGRHPRESGDPVNAGDYWTPAFAGVTARGGCDRRKFGRRHRNADQVR